MYLGFSYYFMKLFTLKFSQQHAGYFLVNSQAGGLSILNANSVYQILDGNSSVWSTPWFPHWQDIYDHLQIQPGIMSILPRSRIYGIKIRKHGMLVLFITFFIMRWLIASCRYRLFNKREQIFSVGNYILQENVIQNLLTKHAFKTCNNRVLQFLDRYLKRLNNYSSRFGKRRLWFQGYCFLLRGS